MVFTFLKCWHEGGGRFRPVRHAGKGSSAGLRHAAAADLRPSRTGGKEEWGNDHILATKRYDRGRAIHDPTVIPCRNPTNGIRHAFDLVKHLTPFKRHLIEPLEDHRLVKQNSMLGPPGNP